MEANDTDTGICINCLSCIPACPQRLLPNYLYHFCLRDLSESLDTYRLPDCTVCGACTQVCPAGLPLSETLAKGKAKLLAEAGGEETSMHGA